MVKVPSFFKKTITETVLKKKYLKYIEYHDDKNFIRACYAEDDDGASGNLRLRQDLSEKDVLRLKGLVKAIKGNRKAAVKIIPLAVAAAVIASIAVFFAVMANPLLQRGLETALEAVFQARVNASRFRISLFRLEMAMDSLTIADRDSPMRNLIQFSAMKIRFSPQAAIRGRVYIEEIRADNIRFGTARTVSGALPARAPKPPSEREAIEIPPLVDVQNFDATALLNREFDRLQTPRLHSAAVESYQTSVARWQGEQAAVRARVEEIQSRAEPLLAININDFRVVDLQTAEQTLARIRTTIDQTNAMISTVQDAQNDVNRIASGVEADMNTARALEQNARNAFQADFNRLRSFIDLGSGTAMEVLEAIVMSIVTDSAMEYVTYGQRALEILQTVRAAQEKLPRSSRPPRAARFRGRDVQFAANKYPRFFMGIMATDVLTTSGWHWGFDLRGVSSDPDISAVPTTLSLTLAETDAALNRRGALNAQADLRSDATERFNAEFSGAGFPVNISAGLDSIGAGGFSGGAAFSLNAAGNVDGGFSTGG
ncbi:MAG: hypothetical protein FWD91_04935, partial [Treponema sp.]|nr:hypothetical protein [Treponema sp.]